MISTTREGKLPVRAAVVAALVVAALAALRLHHPAARPSELAPDPAALHYRHPLSAPAADPADLASTIRVLEDRTRRVPSPFDDAELAELYLKKAQLDGDPADYQTADAMARRSLAVVAEPNPAVLTLAKLANVRHDFRDAIELARRPRKRTAGAQIILATAHLALGELADASADAEAALAQKPDTAGYLTRALIRQAQGRDAEAAFDFQAAARHEEPGDLQGAARLRALWGRFLLRRGELTSAAQAFDEAVRIVPGFALALAYRGELALRTGRAREAAHWFEQAFAGARQVRYLIDQARALELAGDRASADALRTQVEAIVRGELGEGGLGHRLDLAEVLVDRGRAGDLVEALGLAREEVARRPSFEARFQLARALTRTGARDDALREVQAALASGAHEAQLYELASELERARGNAGASALYTRLADRLDPGSSGWRTIGLGDLGGAR